MMEKIIQLERKDYRNWNSLKLKITFNSGVRIIILNSMGTDPFPVEIAKRIGLTVLSLPDYCSEELSDHAFKLFGNLSAKTRLPLSNFVNVLVVGSEGNVGRKVVQKCRERKFGVLKHDVVLGHSKKDLVDFCNKVDVVFVCIPLIPQTTRLFDSEFFGQMENGNLLFVNVSGRMRLFTYYSIFSALRLGLIGGYACDEVVTDKRLVMHDRMFFTPHVGWRSLESVRRREVFLKELWLEARASLKS